MEEAISLGRGAEAVSNAHREQGRRSTLPLVLLGQWVKPPPEMLQLRARHFSAFYLLSRSDRTFDQPAYPTMDGPRPDEGCISSHGMAEEEARPIEEDERTMASNFEERFEQFYLQLSEGKTGGMVVRE